jgi:hypothetical protein
VPLDPNAAAIIEYMVSTFPEVDTTVSGTEMRRRIAESTAQIGPIQGGAGRGCLGPPGLGTKRDYPGADLPPGGKQQLDTGRHVLPRRRLGVV